jgi:hypothetical protein
MSFMSKRNQTAHCVTNLMKRTVTISDGESGIAVITVAVRMN